MGNLNQPHKLGAILLSPIQTIGLASGTIIVLQRDGERFIVIADSRLSSNDQAEDSSLRAIAFYTAIHLKALFQDIAAQDAAHLFAGVHKDNLMQMIIGGTTDRGDLIAYCIQIKIQANEVAPYPLIVFTVDRWDSELKAANHDSHESSDRFSADMPSPRMAKSDLEQASAQTLLVAGRTYALAEPTYSAVSQLTSRCCEG